jgi:hypothetical protein
MKLAVIDWSRFKMIRTAVEPRTGHYTFGLIWTAGLSILLQTPLNNDVLKFLRAEPASSRTAFATSGGPGNDADAGLSPGLSALPQTV